MNENYYLYNKLGMLIMLTGSKLSWHTIMLSVTITSPISHSVWVYNSLARSFPRRFVLPLNIGLNAPEGENLILLSCCAASAVKQADGMVGYEFTLD